MGLGSWSFERENLGGGDIFSGSIPAGSMNVCVLCVWCVCVHTPHTRGLTLALVSHPLSLLPHQALALSCSDAPRLPLRSGPAFPV